jgi:hypothetical protein
MRQIKISVSWASAILFSACVYNNTRKEKVKIPKPIFIASTKSLSNIISVIRYLTLIRWRVLIAALL